MKLLVSIGALLVLVGCTLLPSGPGAVVGDFMVTLYVRGRAKSTQAEQGQPIELEISLFNRSRPTTLTLLRRPAYEFIVATEGGMEVWRSPYKHEEIFKEITLWSSGSAFDARVSWDQRDLDGIPVPPGRYWVQGMLYTDRGTLKSQRVELRIRRGSPLRLELEIPSQAPLLFPRQEGYWKLGQPIPLILKLRNVTERPTELTLLGRPAYDFIVTTDYGRREVWRWAQGQAIQEIAELRRLAPWEALEFAVEWDQRDSAGNLIAPGRYCVRGAVRVEPEVVEELPVRCLSVGRGLPVELVLEGPERVKLGEDVLLTWKITNAGNCPVTLVGVQLDFSVTTLDGAVVVSSVAKRWWRFPPLKPPIEHIITLQPGETIEFEGQWDQRDDEDYLVKPGVYLVRGSLWATQQTDAPDVAQSVPRQIIIEP